MDMTDSDDFYEDDEPIEHIREIMARIPHGYTSQGGLTYGKPLSPTATYGCPTTITYTRTFP
jgi:hypothetical protein